MVSPRLTTRARTEAGCSSPTRSSCAPSRCRRPDDWKSRRHARGHLARSHQLDLPDRRGRRRVDSRAAHATGPLAAGVRPCRAHWTTPTSKLGISADANVTGRYATATAVAALVADVLARTDNVAFIEASRRGERSRAPTRPRRARFSTPRRSPGQLQGFNWERLKPLLDAEKQKDERGADAKAALDRLRAALTTDELAQPIGAALQRADNDVFAWLAAAVTPTPTPRRLRRPRRNRGEREARSCATRADIAWVQADIEAFIDEHEGQNIVVEWRIEP